MKPHETFLRSLRQIVGDVHARPGDPRDAIDDVPAGVVVEPGTIEQLSEVVRCAWRGSLYVVPRGSGTKIAWGCPPARVDLIVSTRRLDRVIEHAAGDLVVKVQAGATLDALQQHLALAGQMLALDPPRGGATIGGILAANASGPRRLRYGTARDLLIGITVVLADGTIAKAGGKVVKNVAGYDLGKLFTGSFGTLGIIADATFRLHPRPADRRLVVIEADSAARVGEVVQAIVHSSLVAAAIELSWPAGAPSAKVGILVEGVTPGVVAQSVEAARLVSSMGPARVCKEQEFDREWGEVTRSAYLWDNPLGLPRTGSRVGLKLAARPSDVPRAIEIVREVAGRHDVPCSLAGHAAVGVLYAGLGEGPSERQARAVDEIRTPLWRSGGSVVVLSAPPRVKRLVDVWGPAGDALDLMRRVKDQFDPTGVMAPGRFVCGI